MHIMGQRTTADSLTLTTDGKTCYIRDLNFAHETAAVNHVCANNKPVTCYDPMGALISANPG